MGYAVGMLGVLIARYVRGIREPSMTATTAMVSVASREPAHAYPFAIPVVPSACPSYHHNRQRHPLGVHRLIPAMMMG